MVIFDGFVGLALKGVNAHCKTSMMKLFPNIVNELKSCTVFTQDSIIGVWQGQKHTSPNLL